MNIRKSHLTFCRSLSEAKKKTLYQPVLKHPPHQTTCLCTSAWWAPSPVNHPHPYQCHWPPNPMPYLRHIVPAHPGFSVARFNLYEVSLWKTYPCNRQSHPGHVHHPWPCYSPGQPLYCNVILLLESPCLGIFHFI